jgi:hypothetical protein
VRRLKPLLSILSFVLTASTAMAVDYRWTSSYDQGTPGMFLEVKRIKPQRGESVTVQIVVDGDSFPFELNEIQFTASSRAEKWRFFALVDALVASKQKSFVVEFPKYDTSESFRFSTRASRSDRGKARYSVVAAKTSGSGFWHTRELGAYVSFAT